MHKAASMNVYNSALKWNFLSSTHWLFTSQMYSAKMFVLLYRIMLFATFWKHSRGAYTWTVTHRNKYYASQSIKHKIKYCKWHTACITTEEFSINVWSVKICKLQRDYVLSLVCAYIMISFMKMWDCVCFPICAFIWTSDHMSEMKYLLWAYWEKSAEVRHIIW